MKNSPIQLLTSNFIKICVEPHVGADDLSEDPAIDRMEIQYFDRIEQAQDYWGADSADSADDIARRTFLVTLGVRTVDGETMGPYKFEIIASGVLACFSQHIGGMTPRDAVREYGLTLLFGMLREQLANMTARMPNGIRLLPTVSFVGSRSDVENDPLKQADT